MLLSPMPPMRPSSRAVVDCCGRVGVRVGVVYAEVHGGQPVGAQRAEVLFDAGPQLVGLLRG